MKDISFLRSSAPVEFNRWDSAMPAGDLPYYEGWNKEDAALMSLGHNPELKREFSMWTSFCVSFAIVGPLPSLAFTLYYGLGYAGTGGLAWGFFISFFFIMCIALGMAELCSSMPTSGGLYYASAVLAPPGWGPMAAWFTGWSNWMGQVASAPSVNYGNSAMFLAAMSIAYPDYTPQNYQIFLLASGLLVIHACISSMPTLWIARFNSYGSTFNMGCLIIVIILIPSSVMGDSKFTPSSVVWQVENFTDWPDGIAVLMSFLALILTTAGFEAPFHLSEECSNANIAAPRAICLTAASGGVMGWILQLVVAYTVKDIRGILGTKLGQPWAAYLIQVLPQNTALAILALTFICAFSMGQGYVVTASRVAFAYARDDCFPASFWIKRVNKHTLTPVNAVWFNTGVGICLLLLIFGGTVVIYAIFSVVAIAAYTAFAITIFIRIFFAGNRFRRGPWHLGKFSKPIGIAGCSFVLVMVPIFCFPEFRGSDSNLQVMNWTCVVYGGPMTMLTIWWIVSARKWFKGPQTNAEHQMNIRGPVVEGSEEDSVCSYVKTIESEAVSERAVEL